MSISRPHPQEAGGRPGQSRAYATITLLDLHRHGEIGDADGQASLALLRRAGFRFQNTPKGMSQALHDLRARGLINSDIDRTRNYAMWLTGQKRLTETTFQELLEDEPWAQAIIRNEPHERTPRPGHARMPDVFVVAETLELTTDGAVSGTADAAGVPAQAKVPVITDAPDRGARNGQLPSTTSPFILALSVPLTANEIALIELVLRQHEELRQLRELMELVDAADEVSPQVAGFVADHDPGSSA